MHYERQLEVLRKQLEKILASDACSDPDVRLEVLTKINRVRDRKLGDANLCTPIERELVDGYRRMIPEDRQRFAYSSRCFSCQSESFVSAA